MIYYFIFVYISLWYFIELLLIKLSILKVFLLSSPIKTEETYQLYSWKEKMTHKLLYHSTYIIKLCWKINPHLSRIVFFRYRRLLIGNEECAPPLSIEQTSKSKEKSVFFTIFYKYLKYVKHWPRIQNRNHPICTHKYHCFVHILLVWKD